MDTLTTTRLKRDPEFGARLTSIADANPNVPPSNFGRLGWFKDQLHKRFGEDISIETVRKWLAGEVKPHQKRILMLAELLDVSIEWLAYGVSNEMSQRDLRKANAEADGAVLAVAGLIRMAGGLPAFPLEDDKRAKDQFIDLYATIRGANYSMHVAVALTHDAEGARFAAPAVFEGVMQIGVIPVNDFTLHMVEIPEEKVREGKRKGASIEVVLTAEEIERYTIKSLRERL